MSKQSSNRGDDPKNIARNYTFKGDALKTYNEFINKMNDEFNKEYGELDAAILPGRDKSLLLKMFNYHINNVGDPDGHCQYGLATRGIEFKLLQSVFNYFNMKPYGVAYKGVIDPTTT